MKFKNKEIVSFEYPGKYITVDWILGNYCNFKCSYCFGDLNTGTFRVPKINTTIENNVRHLVKQLQNAGKENILFNLAGGEPTMYHDFDKLTKLMHTLGKVSVITNGSRTISWWQDHYSNLDKVCISYHVEHADLEHTVKVIEFLLDKVDLSVHIMMHNELFEKSKEAALKLKELFNNKDLNLELKLLRDTRGRVVEYTTEQKEFIDQFKFSTVKKNIVPLKTRTIIRLKDESFKLEPKHIKDLEGSFKGYDCFAHQEFVQINQYGNVGNMSCGQIYSDISNIYSDNFVSEFVIPQSAVICNQDICGCLGLLYSSKNINSNKV